MKQFFTRTISSLLILGILVSSTLFAIPKGTFAATETLVQTSDGSVVNKQAATYSGNIEAGKGSAQSNSAANTAGGAVACVAGQILGQLLTSSISSALTSQVTDKATAAVSMSVPVNETGKNLENSNVKNAASVGTTVFGVLIAPSWDSIAWCLINSIIEYIIDATIQWANSGFNGNPAFIDDPEGFFTSLADQEAGAFIQELVSGTGLNVCEPFKVQIGVGLASAYGVNGGKRLSCSLTKIAANAENAVAGAVNGGFDYNDFYMTSQYPQNNVRGLYILGNEEIGARISAKKNTAQLELGWNSGFLNFKRCEDDGTGSGKQKCVTHTPGTLVQSSLEKSLGIPKDRLVLAQKFDQLVTVLINSLIKVALNEILEASSDSNDDD